MRPSVDAWKEWEPTKVGDVRKLVQGLVENGEITQKVLANAAKVSKFKMSRWLAETSSWKIIDQDGLNGIIDCLHGKGLLPIGANAKSPAEYWGLASLFGQTDAQVQDIFMNAPGHYRVFRWSNAKRGRILRGALSIEHSARTRIVTTQERYRAKLRGEIASWPREGYFLGRSLECFALVSRKIGTNEIQTAYLRKPMRTGSTEKPTEMLRFEGVLVDMQGDTIYKTPIIIERVSKPLTNEEICDLAPNDKSLEGIAASLTKMISFEGAISSFS